MSAQLTRVIATKQTVLPGREVKRKWVGANELVDVGNGITFFPYFCRETADDYSLHFFFFNNNKQENIEVTEGEWIKQYLFEVGIKFLPMAISYTNTGRPDAVLIEFSVNTLWAAALSN